MVGKRLRDWTERRNKKLDREIDDSRIDVFHSKDLVGREIGVDGRDVDLASKRRGRFQVSNRLPSVIRWRIK